MTITNSPDISVFDFKVIYDLTGAVPKVRVLNLSSGPALANVKYWFEVYSANGVLFHQGSDTTPDRTGIWDTEYELPAAIPMISGHIDWSGSEYQIVGYVQDSASQVYQTPPYLGKVVRPSGNKSGQKNNWGSGMLSVMMNCCTAKLLVEDQSNYSYAGISGTRLSKKIKLMYPGDDTGIAPAPFEVEDENSVQIPVTFNGKNYQIFMDTVYEYEHTPNVAVRIKYKYKACFDVMCGVDLCAIVCALGKTEDRLEDEGCSTSDRVKLEKAYRLLTRALVGIVQPLCGINVPSLVDQIRDLLGGCEDCEEIGGGINPTVNCAVPVNLQVE